ncbi:MAG: pantetheine-phosphate adenylyltransferase [Candidatus Caenarcaniphilales bacterium]|nr:pantetheine-phosphate adenylyltransferase [Candidatus Caenarcaniphilales bacterium]
MKAIYPGSFDPITNGHLDVIERASQVCDELIVAVLENLEKKSFFSTTERVEMISVAVKELKNVQVISFKGLAVELVRELKADSLIRGMRDIGDFRFEWEAAQLNKNLGQVETLFLMTNPLYAFISSSRVREIARLGGDVSNWVPGSVQKYLKKLKRTGA